MFLSPKTIVLVFFVCTRGPACSSASFVCSIWLRSELTSSSIRLIPSANLSLLVRSLPMLIAQAFCLTWSVNRSRYVVKRSVDRGSPCLFHHPSADCVFRRSFVAGRSCLFLHRYDFMFDHVEYLLEVDKTVIKEGGASDHAIGPLLNVFDLPVRLI